MSIESQWAGRPVGDADPQVDAPAEPAVDLPVDLVDEADDVAGVDGFDGDGFDGDEPDDGSGAGSELPEPPQTGDEAVDRAVAQVARAVIHPLEDQVAVIDAAHRTLQDRLADVEG